MSGPKGIELAMMRLAAERQQNRDQCAPLLAQYRRLARDCEQVRDRLLELGGKAVESAMSASRLEQEVEDAINDDHGAAAARLCEDALAELQAYRSNTQARLQTRITELQTRFLALPQQCVTVAGERQELTTYSQSVIPENWPAEEKRQVQSTLDQKLSRVPNVAPVAASLTRAGVRKLEAMEAAVKNALRMLAEARSALERSVNDAHGRVLAGQVRASGTKPMTLAGFLAKQPPPPPPLATEVKVVEKLDKLMADVAALQDTGAWTSLMQRAERIRSEKDAERRRLQYGQLVLDCDVALSQLRAATRFRAEVAGLVDCAASFRDSPAVAVVIAELEALQRSGNAVDLDPMAARLKAARETALHERDMTERRRAVVDSLQELGYEVTDGSMGTALVAGGRVVFRRPDEDEYAVEVVTTPNCDLVQTAMIRYSDSATMSEQQRLRDTEREESWCADHARLREKLAKRGFDSRFRLKLPSGQHPVRIEVKPELVKGRQRRAAAPQAKQNASGQS